MDQFIFRIPDRIEELEDVENFEQYYLVQNNYQLQNIDSLLDNVDQRYRSEGVNAIIESFDVFYHVIKHFSELNQSVRDKAWVLLSKALVRFQAQLVAFFENFLLDQRKAYQNKLCMLMYPFLMITEFYEEDLVSIELNPISESSGRSKKKRPTFKSPMYQNHKYSATNTILKIFSLHLERLFDPPYFLNSFVNIITKYAYNILENSSSLRNSNSNQSMIFDNVCNIIATALDRYNHSVNFCMKIIELLQAKETMVGPCSQLMTTVIKEERHIYLRNILEQIKSININILSKDNSAPKAISLFLIELTKNCPDKMFQCLSYLIDFLEQDSYTMRNSVLEIICIIILKMFLFTTKNRDAQIKDRLLDYLFDHILDVNSYTRSKVLQLWSKLAESQAIPITRLNSVTSRIVDRLSDRSCFVRKNSVHYLTQTIKDNPFTILSKNELSKCKSAYQKLYIENRDKLSAIEEQQNKFAQIIQLGEEGDEQPNSPQEEELNSSVEANKENEVDKQLFLKNKRKMKNDDEFFTVIAAKRQKMMEEIQALANQWLQIENEFCIFWKNKKDSIEFSEFIPENIPQENIDSAFEFFRSLVKEKKFEQALRVLSALKSMYPNEPVFAYRKRPNNNQEKGETEMNDIGDEGEDIEDEDDFSSIDGLFDINDQLFFSVIT